MNPDPIKLVFDCRVTEISPHCGIARFIQGICLGLVEVLNQQENPRFKLLLITRNPSPDWIQNLVLQFPNQVQTFTGETPFSRLIGNRPMFLWSSIIFKLIYQLTNGNLFWIAPANFDRPLLLSFNRFRTKHYRQVIQVVHDLIPLYFPKSCGFWFRISFRFLLRRSLRKLPYVATISYWTHRLLQEKYPKSQTKIIPLINGIERIFGSQKKENWSSGEKIQQRKAYLIKLGIPEENALILSSAGWLLGVGRVQSYKRWDLANQVSQILNTQGRKNIFIHVGTGQLQQQENILTLPWLSDSQMEELYRLADVLIHPSLAEGFGLPVLEAALSGLPVVFRQNTAISGHFPPGSLPQSFWCSVSAEDSNTWAQAVDFVLKGNAELQQLNERFYQEPTRVVIAKRLGVETVYDWKNSAAQFLEALS